MTSHVDGMMAADSDDCVIATFQPEDMDAILTVERRSFPQDTYTEQDFLDVLEEARHGFLVARCNTVVAGYALGVVFRGVGYIASIAVDPDFRGRGLGNRLVESLLARLLALGAGNMELHVRTDNTTAIRLYERFGFTVERRLRGYYEDGDAAYLMRKSI